MCSMPSVWLVFRKIPNRPIQTCAELVEDLSSFHFSTARDNTLILDVRVCGKVEPYLLQVGDENNVHNVYFLESYSWI